MWLPARINRPEYLFRPTAVLKRLRPRADGWRNPGSIDEVRLPWSQTISVFRDGIGRSIRFSGVFDPCVTEAIYRLLDPGDAAVDVGANVGYLTNLMATRAGLDGSVLAYEPHPLVFGVLELNVARWNSDGRIARIQANRMALSSHAGKARLATGDDFEDNMGLASLCDPGEPGRSDGYDVRLGRLDEILGDRDLQLLKVDVEGHEHAVLQGAEQLLIKRRIRDVVFEDHGRYPTPTMAFLERHGMSLFTLRHSLLGLRAHPAEESPAPSGWPGPNYLGTLDPARAKARLGSRGWRSLNLSWRSRFRTMRC